MASEPYKVLWAPFKISIRSIKFKGTKFKSNSLLIIEGSPTGMPSIKIKVRPLEAPRI